MKYPFKLSKSNKIYALIVVVLIIILNLINYGFDLYAFGYSFGYSFVIILIPILLAWIYPLKRGGTIIFNIVLTIMLLVSIIKFVQISKDRQKPKNDLQNEVTVDGHMLN
jgi:membrane protein implicated in regulation of membrane protease activity